MVMSTPALIVVILISFMFGKQFNRKNKLYVWDIEIGVAVVIASSHSSAIEIISRSSHIEVDVFIDTEPVVYDIDSGFYTYFDF